MRENTAYRNTGSFNEQLSVLRHENLTARVKSPMPDFPD